MIEKRFKGGQWKVTVVGLDLIFKGDVSKRYKYSEETDTIYDTANHYGEYDKVLDKKEITMLLNEYETILKELEE